MTVIATEGLRQSDVIKRELWAELGYCRGLVKATGAALEIGTLLKQGVTDLEPVGAATDAVVGIVVENIADGKEGVYLKRGPAAVGEAELKYFAGSTAEQKKTVNAALEALGIVVLKSY